MALHEIPVLIGRAHLVATVSWADEDTVHVTSLRSRRGTAVPIRLISPEMERDLIVQACLMEAGEQADDAEADTQVLVPCLDDLALCQARMLVGPGVLMACTLYDGHRESHLSPGGLRWTDLCPGAYTCQETT